MGRTLYAAFQDEAVRECCKMNCPKCKKGVLCSKYRTTEEGEVEWDSADCAECGYEVN